MEWTEIQNKRTKIIVDIFCDCCGESCKVHEGKIENISRTDNGESFYEFEFLELKTRWGYHSNKDTEKWSAQICEKCVDEKLNFIKFKVM